MYHKKKTYIWELQKLFRTTQMGNKIKYLEENKININSLKRNHKEFIKNDELILKTQKVLFWCTKNIRLNSEHYFTMKILNKRELPKIVFNYSSDIDFKGFLNLYKNCTAKLCSFLVIDATLASGGPLRFRKNILERIQKLIMTIDDKIIDEKIQYDINKESSKNISIIIM